MSDLISRRKVYKHIKAEINPYGKPFKGTAYKFGLKLMEYIENMEDAEPVKAPTWIPAEHEVPVDDSYVLLSFENFSSVLIGRYEQCKDGSGNWYLGDCCEEDTCLANDLFVNAWMPLPKPYKGE